MGTDCTVRADHAAIRARGRARRCGTRRLWPSLLVAYGCWLSACSFDREPLFAPLKAATAGDRDAAPVALEGSGGTSVSIGIGAASDAGDGDAGSGYDGDAGESAQLCMPGAAISCKSGTGRQCSADGRSYEPIACGAPGCDAAGKRCNACTPRQPSCRGDRLVQCGPDGRVTQEESCALGCATPPQGTAACNACKADSAQCKGSELQLCRAGQWQATACTQGCDAAVLQCVERRIVPVNLRPDVCRATDASDQVFDGEVELDTDDECDEVVTQQPGVPEICVRIFAHVTISEGAIVRAKGQRALALVATDSLRVDGTLSVSALGATAGAGSVLAGPGIGAVARAPAHAPEGLAAAAGGGGGGHATRGASGGAVSETCEHAPCAGIAGAGGVAYGDETLAPLIGGAAGGRNGAGTSTRRDAAGGGGGALQLVACGQLTLGKSAVLEANGGGGAGGVPSDSDDAQDDAPEQIGSAGLGAGAGGGSGGSILIQARTATFSAAARLVANGGGGGGGASRGMGEADARAGQPGADGLRSEGKAAGGLTADDAPSGGAGGTREAPEAGLAAGPLRAAGGGGGAAGWIRIELGSGPPKLDAVVVSPAASTATVRFE